jgi:hypothetical protein
MLSYQEKKIIKQKNKTKERKRVDSGRRITSIRMMRKGGFFAPQ